MCLVKDVVFEVPGSHQRIPLPPVFPTPDLSHFSHHPTTSHCLTFILPFHFSSEHQYVCVLVNGHREHYVFIVASGFLTEWLDKAAYVVGIWHVGFKEKLHRLLWPDR